MILNFIKNKYARNKILFLLFAGFLITSSIGYYYTLIRETKTIYHYAVKDGPNKDYRIFFERNSEIDEDKKVVKELFAFNYGTIINLKENKAFYISTSQSQDYNQIFEFNFDTSERSIIYSNEAKKDILDTYLFNQDLFILTSEEIIRLNLENKKTEIISQISKNFSYNEFINVKNQKVIMGYDLCKFNKDKCKSGVINKYLVYDLENQKTYEQDKTSIDQDNLVITDFFATNKAYKLVKIFRYENDKGNLNYTLRVFTQP